VLALADSKTDDAALHALIEDHPFAHTVDLSRTHVSAIGLEALSDLVHLEELSVAGLNLALLPPELANLPGLRVLDVSGTTLNLAKLPQGWPQLTTLVARNTDLGKRDLAALRAAMPSLKTLDARGTDLKDRHLAGLEGIKVQVDP
jgi:Leucine-rich repeat (LRR) protein